jgi:hypothetical protein
MSFKLNSYFKKIDLPLLGFISVLMIDAIWLKPLALSFSIFWLAKLDWKAALKEAPPFYPLIIAFCVVQYFIIGDYSKEYLIFFSIGILFWMTNLLAFILLYARIKNQNRERIYQTLVLFFYINIIITTFQLVTSMLASKTINPYSLWDNPAFGSSTGDLLKGIFMGPSYINFMANSFFCIYFINKRKLLLSIIALIVLCITSSNFAILFFVPVYLMVIMFVKVRGAKLAGLVGMGFIILFYTYISEGNLKYLAESLFKIEHHYKKENVGKLDQTVSIFKVAPQEKDIAFFKDNKGKVIAFMETYAFIKQNPKNFLFGAGIGNFSSLLAKRQSDIQLAYKSRLFKQLPLRISKTYYDNHYTIEKHVYNLSSDWHSIQHLPSSFANQIIGEYGIIGMFLFLIYYVGFILRRSKFSIVFFPMACLMGYYLLFDYLFEYISIVTLFELFYIVFMIDKENGKELQS